jgi:DmsE family decaheme c-type cytochrome
MNEARWYKFLLIFLLCCTPLVLIFTVSGASGQEETTPPVPAPAGYAGEEQCAACHEDVATGWKKNVHAGKGFEMRSALSCETCHGPGAAHVESGGDKTLIKSFKTMKASEASETCMGCHENGKQAMWHGSVHANRDLSCVTCHSVHNPKSEKFQLKAARVEQTCETCHLQVKAQIQKTSHHPVREGLMTCSDCHNPHGTETPKMLTAHSVNEQCYTCHTEKRGPFLWEHPPVKENCLTCHTPHGSNHPKLMAAKRPFICQSCHMDTRHPGTLYDGSLPQLSSNRDFSRSCSNCHLTVHGSNHPSGWTFTR